MQISDIMTNQVISVSPETPVEEVAQIMQKHNIGSVPVCCSDGLVGIITDRDIVVRNVAHGTDSKSLTAHDVMTSDVTSVSRSTSVRRASEIMAGKQIRRLPVVENNKVVGMVTLGDIATDSSVDMEALRALDEISEPSQPFNM